MSKSADDPVWERFRAEIAAHSMAKPQETVVVAVSGGPDSTALLHLFWRLSREPGWGLRLWVAHLDHGFRGREAEEDAEAVRRLAGRIGLPASIARMDVAGEIHRRKLSKQVGARECRYAFLRRVASLTGATRIALGHTADDQAETVLLHLLRGTGLTGLAGIPPVRGEFVRPLLTVWRADILRYLEKAGLEWRVDRTNLEPVYARNRVRLQLLPELEERYNPRIKEQLVRLATVAADEDRILEEMAAEARRGVWLVTRSSARIDARRLAALPVGLQRRVLRQAVEAIAGEGSLPDFRTIERLRAMAGSLASSREHAAGERLELGARLVAEAPAAGSIIRLSFGMKGKGGGFAEDEKEVQAAPGAAAVPLAVPGKTALWPGGPAVVAEELPWNEDLDPRRVAATPETAVIDLAKVTFPLWLRRRRPGDRFRPLGAGGTQKLKEFFIDHRVPAGERERIPLVVSGADGEEIVWVAGYRIDERYRVDRYTARVLLLRLENGTPSAAQRA